jgi:transcriptional antiterminator RfaH
MSFWAVARVHPQRESFAAEHLEARGFEVFLPKIETERTVQPLFRGYAFVMVVDRWRAIERTFGVLCLIRWGDCPVRCPDAEIEALKARADKTGVIRLPAPAPQRVIRKGAKVKIISGPFTGLAGV